MYRHTLYYGIVAGRHQPGVAGRHRLLRDVECLRIAHRRLVPGGVAVQIEVGRRLPGHVTHVFDEDGLRLSVAQHAEAGRVVALLATGASRSPLLPGVPTDIIGYQLAMKAFPQQPTGDQFFDEAQWESYRRLGEISMARLLETCPRLLA